VYAQNGVPAGVGQGVRVGAGVRVGNRVAVFVGVLVGVGVDVRVAVGVRVLVGDEPGGAVGIGVAVGAGVDTPPDWSRHSEGCVAVAVTVTGSGVEDSLTVGVAVDIIVSEQIVRLQLARCP